MCGQLGEISRQRFMRKRSVPLSIQEERVVCFPSIVFGIGLN